MVASDHKHAFKAFERTQHTREVIMIIISRIIPNVHKAFGAMVPMTQTNQHQISQKKTPLKGLFKANGLFSDLCD